MPGPPSEFIPMARDFVAPRLDELAGKERETVRGFLAAGVGESFASRLAEKALGGATPDLAYTANFEGTRVYVGNADPAEVEREFGIVHAALGADALPEGEFALAPYLVKLLAEKNLTLGTAESCTGGMVAAAIVDVPGASQVFRGGVVAYDNAVKHEVLHVPAETLERFGAVSAETAEAMARGAAAVLEADCVIATTGIAGPSGGTPEKPVGLVYVGVFCRGECAVEEFHFRGERAAVRSRTVAKGLLKLVRMLKEK